MATWLQSHMKGQDLSSTRRALIGRAAACCAAGLAPWSLAAQVPEARVVRIGVVKISSHAVLDAAEKGFETALANAGFKEGTHVVYDRQDAQGSLARAEAIGQQFVADKVDLVHSMSTLATLGVLKSVSQIPVVFSAVADPVGAGIVPRNSTPGSKTGTNVTGVNHLWPVALQLEIFTRLAPEARRWGAIYNPEEPNAAIHVRLLREAMLKRGLTLIVVTVSQSSEVDQALQALAGKVQAMALAADNTTAVRVESIARFCDRQKIALFGGDSSSIGRGAVAAYGMDYTQLGYQAGKKAALILMGVPAGDIPWGPADKLTLGIDRRAARRQGVTIPPEMLRMAERVLR
jgi:putative tryptophan/tyrosine transport system substrate-binding protein